MKPQSSILKIAYNGELLQSGTMDVRDLAPALLAFSGFVDAVNTIVNGKDTKISIQVKSFEKGSFGIEFLLADAGLLQGIVDILSGDNASAIANLLEIIGGVSGVAWLIRKLRHRKNISEMANTVTIELNDGEVLRVPAALYKAASDAAVQRYFFEALKPMTREGIDSFSIYGSGADAAATTRITKAEIPEFEPIEETEILTSDIRVLFCTVLDLSFESQQWRFSDGESAFTATVLDDAFLQAVRDGSRIITPSTQLKVEVKLEQRRVIKNLRTSRSILRVLAIE
jgi:hypothetical protein